jgi:hypothetical protein
MRGVQVYRAYAMYEGNLKIIALPIAVYLSFIGVAIAINLSLSNHFGGSLALPNVHVLTTAFFPLSAGLNVLVTILIAAKLLYFRHHVGKYLTIIVVLVESAALYTTCSVVFVILDQIRSPAEFWFGAVVNCSAVCSSFTLQARETLTYS